MNHDPARATLAVAEAGSAPQPGELLAAVDIGSNSFHLAVARYEHGGLRVIDRMREPVQLAMGLGPGGVLDAEYRTRALACLARFGQRLRALPSGRVRAVATNAVRRLAHPQAFLIPAETALGHPIEVVAGREEARLIYLGVAHGLSRTGQRRLVFDIGGGSTEFIIGDGFEALATESVQVGCIASTRRFFPDGRVTPARWQRGCAEIALELQQFAADFRALGWREAYGSSGTARAIGAVVQANGWCESGITLEALARLREAILAAGDCAGPELAGLADDRRSTLAGGALILEAVCTSFGLARLDTCDTAMREGLLYDLVGPAMHGDPRATSIAALATRHGTDRAQAARVREVALAMFDQVAAAWQLDATARDLLSWAAEVHEVGLAIAHSQHHVHGAYIVANSDLDGFSRQGQQALAAIVRSHRRKPERASLEAVPGRLRETVRRLTALLRLAALLQRARTGEPPPPFRLVADGSLLRFGLPGVWLDQHSLTRTDLEKEPRRMAQLGLALEVERAA